jgi:hypothetical protein
MKKLFQLIADPRLSHVAKLLLIRLNFVHSINGIIEITAADCQKLTSASAPTVLVALKRLHTLKYAKILQVREGHNGGFSIQLLLKGRVFGKNKAAIHKKNYNEKSDKIRAKYLLYSNNALFTVLICVVLYVSV